VTPVAVQLVEYTLRPLSVVGWPTLEAPLPGHFMPGVAMPSCHVLSSLACWPDCRYQPALPGQPG